MRPFQFVTAASLSQAVELLSGDLARSRPIAGGTDLLGEIKEGIVAPEMLVSLQDLPGLRGISVNSDGVRIGALTTVAEVETHPEIVRRLPALAQAAASVATPQIRNVGTVGGNLCQRPRCWFYRSRLYHCRKKGGDTCFAISGSNKYHAILGGAGCYIVHPSDLAVALIALDGKAAVTGPGGRREIPLADFFIGPDRNILAENVLQPGEVLSEILFPGPSQYHRSIYIKAKERQSMDFALASVALAAEVSDSMVRDARVVLGGVAPVPLRVRHAEDALRGKAVRELSPDEVGQAAVMGAQPLQDNGYKVRLTASIVARAVRALLLDEGP